MTISNSAKNSSPDNALEAFIDAVSDLGLELSPGDVVHDGDIHRCNVDGRDDDAGAYWLRLDGDPVGWARNWASGENDLVWFYDNGEPLSGEELEERKRARAAREQEMAAKREREAQAAKDLARRIWDTAVPATEHAYLTKKKIAPCDLRVSGGDLIVPMRDVNGEVQFIQRITPAGRKEFQLGSRVTGLSWRLGPEPINDETVVIAEGVATGASVHAAASHIVLVAFNRGNLEPVAKAVHRKWPKVNIVIAADDDHTTEAGTGTNPGLKDAMAAARAVKGKVAVPDWGDTTRGDGENDFNDLANHAGIDGADAVRRAFEKAAKPDDLLRKIVLDDHPRALAQWVQGELAGLKGRNPVTFERLRTDYKKAGGRVRVLDGVADADEAADDGEKEKETKRQVDQLVSIALNNAKLFHTAKDVPYADLSVNGVRETRPIRGYAFERWLRHEYRKQGGSVPSSEALSNAIKAIEGDAHYDGEERDVFIRVAGHGDAIYIDLGDPTWRAIEIDATGWRIVNEPPVRFRRSDGALPLPVPVKGGSIRDLRPFLNVRTEAAFVIAVAFLVGAFSAKGPYLILAVYGPGGSAKTTAARLLRLLIDPRKPQEEGFPRDRDTLILNASLAHLLIFDNISVISTDMSDDLAKLATGTGLSKRALYENEEQTIFEACRPILLNGIDTFVVRGDLASRTVTTTLEEISSSERKTERRLYADFEAARPGIFGALLDAVSNGLRHLAAVEAREGERPRMADASDWIEACETGAPWGKDKAGRAVTFREAQMADSEETALAVLATNRLAVEVRRLVAPLKDGEEWKGTVGGLYDKLNEEVGEEARKALEREKKWPKDTIRLSGALRRIQGHLPYWGIGVAFGEHTKEGREVYLRRLPAVTRKSSSPSSPSSPANEIKDLAGASGRHPNVFRHPHHHPRRATALATSRVTLPVTLN